MYRLCYIRGPEGILIVASGQAKLRRVDGWRENRRRSSMTLGIAHLSPIISIIFGILILIMPRFLNYFVAIYLILAGLLGLGAFR
jgi:Protein of unknown function (DUF3096)